MYFVCKQGNARVPCQAGTDTGRTALTFTYDDRSGDYRNFCIYMESSSAYVNGLRGDVIFRCQEAWPKTNLLEFSNIILKEEGANWEPLGGDQWVPTEEATGVWRFRCLNGKTPEIDQTYPMGAYTCGETPEWPPPCTWGWLPCTTSSAQPANS